MNDPFCEEGLERKEWNDVLVKYLLGNPLTPDEYERMNAYQATVVQEIKRAVHRIEYKQEHENSKKLHRG